MSNALVIFVRDDINDEQLSIDGCYIPFEIKSRCESLFEEIFFSIPKNYSGKLEDIGVVRQSHDIAFWKALLTQSEQDLFMLVQADAWFLDPAILSEMIDLHRKNLSEFTFSENLPEGIGGEILSRSLIETLPDPAEDAVLLSVSQAVKANINQFDVEIYYKDPDIRSKRIDFLAADPRERVIMQNIREEWTSLSNDSSDKPIPPYKSAAEIISLKPEVLYVAPSYYEIEVTTTTNMLPIYSLRPKISRKSEYMEPAVFSKIMDDADAFGQSYSVSLGGGEALLHPSIQSLITKALSSSYLKTLIVESDGLSADDTFCAFLRHLDDPRVKVIIECCGYDRKSYSSIHQSDSFEQVEKNILALGEILNTKDKKNLFIQIMKINETEVFLDQFYDYWEPRNVGIILQKQNTWLGLVEDRRYYDLSPIERIPCWHLQRDLYITCDGDIPFCKQDVQCKSSSSILQNSLTKICEQRKDSFVKNYKGEYTDTIDCSACDEWYTFNL